MVNSEGHTREEENPPISTFPSLSEEERLARIEESRNSFYHRRRIQIENLPPNFKREHLREDILPGFELMNISFIHDTAHILLATPEDAKAALEQLKDRFFRGRELFSCYSQVEYFLFVGNIPYHFQVEDFRQLMERFGEIERIFLVLSPETGHSKGYGFVEYVSKESANRAKKEFSEHIGGRSLRIDFANPNLIEYEDLHSQTLFVDRFSPNTTDEQLLRFISAEVPVLFCQIAIHPLTKKPRNFALVDFRSPEDAEYAWRTLDGSEFLDGTIRVAFSSPGRSGASIVGFAGRPPPGMGPRGRGMPDGPRFPPPFGQGDHPQGFGPRPRFEPRLGFRPRFGGPHMPHEHQERGFHGHGPRRGPPHQQEGDSLKPLMDMGQEEMPRPRGPRGFGPRVVGPERVRPMQDIRGRPPRGGPPGPEMVPRMGGPRFPGVMRSRQEGPPPMEGGPRGPRGLPPNSMMDGPRMPMGPRGMGAPPRMGMGDVNQGMPPQREPPFMGRNRSESEGLGDEHEQGPGPMENYREPPMQNRPRDNQQGPPGSGNGNSWAPNQPWHQGPPQQGPPGPGMRHNQRMPPPGQQMNKSSSPSEPWQQMNQNRPPWQQNAPHSQAPPSNQQGPPSFNQQNNFQGGPPNAGMPRGGPPHGPPHGPPNMPPNDGQQLQQQLPPGNVGYPPAQSSSASTVPPQIPPGMQPPFSAQPSSSQHAQPPVMTGQGGPSQMPPGQGVPYGYMPQGPPPQIAPHGGSQQYPQGIPPQVMQAQPGMPIPSAGPGMPAQAMPPGIPPTVPASQTTPTMAGVPPTSVAPNAPIPQAPAIAQGPAAVPPVSTAPAASTAWTAYQDAYGQAAQAQVHAQAMQCAHYYQWYQQQAQLAQSSAATSGADVSATVAQATAYAQHYYQQYYQQMQQLQQMQFQFQQQPQPTQPPAAAPAAAPTAVTPAVVSAAAPAQPQPSQTTASIPQATDPQTSSASQSQQDANQLAWEQYFRAVQQHQQQQGQQQLIQQQQQQPGQEPAVSTAQPIIGTTPQAPSGQTAYPYGWPPQQGHPSGLPTSQPQQLQGQQGAQPPLYGGWPAQQEPQGVAVPAASGMSPGQPTIPPHGQSRPPQYQPSTGYPVSEAQTMQQQQNLGGVQEGAVAAGGRHPGLYGQAPQQGSQASSDLQQNQPYLQGGPASDVYATGQAQWGKSQGLQQIAAYSTESPGGGGGPDSATPVSQLGGTPQGNASAQQQYGGALNWMYSHTQTTDSVQPQHFSKPVLYSESQQFGEKRAGDEQEIYDPGKRPRY